MSERKYTIIDVVKDIVTGRIKFATRKENRERRSICDVCVVRDVATNVCTACGCFLPLKRRLKHSVCPLELWGDVD